MRLTVKQQQFVGDALRIMPSAVRTFRKRHGSWRALLSRIDVDSVCHLAICKAARTYDPARSRVTTYFSMAIRNALVKACRKEYRYVQATTEQKATPRDPDVEHLGRRRTEQLQGAVQLAIARLPDRSKLLLHLKFARKMSLRQMAEHSGRDARTIQRLMTEAMDELETLLRNEFGRHEGPP